MHFDSESIRQTLLKKLPTTTIQFELQEHSRVTLKLLRFGSRDTVLNILNNELFAAGVYEVDVDMSRLTNGVYIAHFIINGTISERQIVLLNTDVNQLIQTAPLATSDPSGKFSLPLSLLAIGTRFITTNEIFQPDTLWISRSVDLVLYKQGFQPLVTPVTIDPNKSVEMTFRLQQ